MIIILTNDGDISSDIVIDWLNFYRAPYLRINTTDLLNREFTIDISSSDSASIKLGNDLYSAGNVGAVWYRKFGFFRRTPQAKIIEKATNAYTVGHLSTEFTKVMDTVVNLFSDSYWLTDPQKINLTKPIVLRMAERHGFNIPKTYITNNKRDLKEMADREPIISKSIYDPMSIVHKRAKYLMFTKKVTTTVISQLPDLFLPSMVQECVDKQYEIRTFYLEKQCHSMAILSQSDNQTLIDYRKYNVKKPNRFVPIHLSADMENRICNLMEDLGLNTGSLDFIVQPDNTIVFLEVNPTGQFGMVDFPCNYGLHKQIAELLINKDRTYGKNHPK